MKRLYARALRILWPLRCRLRDWNLQRKAPWPLVWECYGGWKEVPHRQSDGTFHATCRQCDGSHWHEWKPWGDAPSSFSPGVPVRCVICGGRKCDVPECMGRRHHADPHGVGDGFFEPVGGY